MLDEVADPNFFSFVVQITAENDIFLLMAIRHLFYAFGHNIIVLSLLAIGVGYAAFNEKRLSKKEYKLAEQKIDTAGKIKSTGEYSNPSPKM